MKVVIDIPETAYKSICLNSLASWIFDAIRDGTPLPKGHGRLIDADKMIGDILTVPQQYEELADWCAQVTAGQPTILEADKKGGGGEE